MNYAPDGIKPLLAISSTLLLGGALAAQPLCDVLLRPAFHYSANGLVLIVADSSSTFGLEAEASWSFGDGSAASTVPYHAFAEPGTYEVCLTLTHASLPCATTYCRQVIIPLSDCSGTMDAYFEWYPSGTNSASLVDASLNQNTSSVLWEFGDGSTSSDPYPNWTWQLPGPHFVCLTRQDKGCVATYSRWVEVDGNASTCGPGLFANFFAYPNGLDVTYEPSISATNVLPVISVWSYGDGVVDTVSVGYHTYANEGSYQTCLLVGALRMPALDSCFALVCNTTTLGFSVGLPEPGPNVVQAWPNPFDGALELGLNGPAGPVVIRLFDAVGRLAFATTVVTADRVTLDTGALAAGPYHLIIDHGGSSTRTIVIKAPK